MKAIRSLWNAVIMRAYRDALGMLDNVPECSRAPLMAQASAWFSEKEGVFETLCDELGLDPKPIREALSQRKQPGSLRRVLSVGA